MNHTAIFALYPNVVTIDDTAGSKDVDGNTVVIDEALVNAWVDPNAYKYAREQAYPSIGDQLDMQYHDSVDGTTTWEDAIAKVKTDNPKPA
jgi:hypothetical protein